MKTKAKTPQQRPNEPRIVDMGAESDVDHAATRVVSLAQVHLELSKAAEEVSAALLALRQAKARYYKLSDAERSLLSQLSDESIDPLDHAFCNID